MSALSRVAERFRTAGERLLGGADRRMTAAVVLPLAETSSNWMVRSQIDLLRRRGRNPALEASPHVSLKLGFKVADPEPLAAWLERLARESPPVQLTLRDVGRFEEGIIYVNVVATPELERLRQRVLRDLRTEFGVAPGRFEGDEFRFHATLTYGLPREAVDDELAALRRERVEFRETSRFVDLWLHTGTHWLTYRRAVLSGRGEA